MREPQEDRQAGVYVDRIMLHDLVNHLTLALGHSDLLLLDTADDSPDRSALQEIRDACQKAADLIDSWTARLPPEP
jgi:hypothetical protein